MRRLSGGPGVVASGFSRAVSSPASTRWPVSSSACRLTSSAVWTAVYMLVGVVSGGIFDSPVAAMLVATGAVLVIGLVANLVSSRRRAAAEAHGEADLTGSPELR